MKINLSRSHFLVSRLRGAMEPASAFGPSFRLPLQQKILIRNQGLCGMTLPYFPPRELVMSSKCSVSKKLLPVSDTNSDTTKTLEFLDLPPEVREVIYDRVTNHDIKSLRQVCRQILEEVDYMFGVSGILHDEDSGNLEWIRCVKVRSLRVKNYWPQLTDASVLSMPSSLKKLLVLPQPLSPTNLKALLKGAKGIRELTLLCSNDWKMTRLSPILTQLLVAINHEFSDIILEGIRGNHDLIDLQISLPPYSNKCTSNILEMDHSGYKAKEYHTGQDIPGCRDYSRKLKSIRIIAPFMSVESFDQWKILFDLQTRLECVHCVMGMVHWSLYSKMLQNCYRTLKAIVLQDVQSFYPDCLFDWSILSQCPCLEALHILAKFEVPDGIHGHGRFFESINFSLVNMANLRELTLMFVHLNKSEFEKIFNGAPKLAIINLFFVRRPRDFYPILRTVSQALKKSRTIQMVHIADTSEHILHPTEIPKQEFQNEMELLDDHYICSIRECRSSKEPGAMIFPMIHIMRFPIEKTYVLNDDKWSQYVNITFPNN